MMTLFNSTSEFVIAFTNTLVHSFWIGASLWMLMKALLLLVRDNHAGIRYWVSTSVLLLFVSGSVVLFTLLFSPASSGQPASGNGSLNSLFLMSVLNSPSPGELSSMHIYYQILWKVYLIGLSLFTLRWIVSAFQIRRIINKAESVESTALSMLLDMKKRLGIRKNISLLSSQKLTAPALYGFFKPVIIVPVGMFFHLPGEQVESILMHELVHVKRMDFFVNLLQSAVELLFFFNPFVWLISRQIRAEREKYCDDMVVDSGSSPSVYAKALLNLSLLQSNKFELAISATGNNQHVLLKRIQRLLNTNTMKTKTKQKALFTYLLVVSTIVVLVSSGFRYSFFTIDKGGYDTVARTENTIYSEEKVAEALSDPVVTVTADPFVICDTIIGNDLDSMSEEEWEEYRESLEEGLEELENLDLDEMKEELELHLQEMHVDMEIDRQKMMQDMEMAREELKNLDKEEIKRHLEEAKLHMDTIKSKIDWEKMEQELELASQALELNIQEIMVNVEEAMRDIDLDFDFDFDFDQELEINIDSIMKNAQIAIEEIDFDEIKQDIEDAMQKMEKEMQELDKRIKEKKEKK